MAVKFKWPMLGVIVSNKKKSIRVREDCFVSEKNYKIY